MADITLNSAVRSNLRTMQATTELMNRTENRLSTGKKVNSALDNPTNFFTAQSLERRAGDLGSLLDSVSNSVKTLEAADNGISAITDLVEQMKSTARSAQQSSSAIGTRAAFESTAISGATADKLLGDGLQTVTGSVVMNSLTVAAAATGATDLSGGANTDTLASDIADGDTLTVGGETIRFYTDNAARVADTANAGDTQLLITDDIDDVLSAIETAIPGSTAAITAGAISVEGAAGTPAFTFGGTAATKLGLPTTASTAATAFDGNTLEVTVGDKSMVTVTFGGAAGQVNTLEELNTALKDSGARAKLSTTGELTIETTNANEADQLVIGGTMVSTDGSADGAAGEIFDLADSDSATKLAVVDDDKQRVSYKNDYNDLKAQIEKLAKDASYNGVNLLAGDDLKVVFNEDGTSNLDIGGVDVLDTLGLEDIAETDFLDSSSIDAVIEKLNGALKNLDGQSSKFGSQLSVVQTRQDFTKDMIGALEDGANLLTAADTNEEAANLATLQTRQSLIVSSLSISTQQEQNILQLLR